MNLSHTIQNRGASWAPSMGGVGMVGTDEITKVRWNDAKDTVLTVAGTTAFVDHAGKRHSLKWICGSHEVVVNYWLPRIQRRLEDARLTNQVRGGWNSDLPSNAA